MATRVRNAMAKILARKWLEANSSPEYRLTVLAETGTVKSLPSLLRAFRDNKVRIASVPMIPDLGVRVEGDKMILRSGNRTAIAALDAWMVSKGFETTGVW